MSLFSELRRRNVVRVAGLYLVVAWLLLQVAGFLENALKLPDWFDGLVTALVLLGFPVALILAWAFELTPEGVRPTTSSDDPPAPTRAVDWLLVVLLTVVAGMLIWNRVSPPIAAGLPVPPVAEAPAETTGPVAVAVLPFADLSPEGDQDYFSDGLAEELLNVLARESGLRVAGRTSSFAFKGKQAPVKDIAAALNVSHVLEGSVRKAGKQIRVSVQLVKAADGFPIFSESYDRSLEDIFAVQDEIARAVGRALELRFTLSPRARAPDVGAYEQYLTARELIYTRTRANLLKAESLLETAMARAPEYAPIYASLAVVKMLLSDMQGGYGERDAKTALPEAKGYVDRALELDPELADAHAVLGLYRDSRPGLGDSVPPLKRALELNPQHTEAQLWLANARPFSLESFALLERLVDRDPGFIPAVSNLAGHYTRRGDFDRARAVLGRAGAVPGLKDRVRVQLASIALTEGRLAEAYRRAKSALDEAPRDIGARALLAVSLIMLGDFDRAGELGVPEAQAWKLWLTGDIKGAVKVVRSRSPSKSMSHIAMPLYIEAEDYESAAKYFEALHDGKPTTLTGPDDLRMDVANAVFAYKQLGQHDEADRLIEIGTAWRERAKTMGYDFGPTMRILDAEFAAALGEAGNAARFVQASLDSGLIGAASRSPLLARVLSRPMGIKAMKIIRERVNAEREKLGWSPLTKPLDPG